MPKFAERDLAVAADLVGDLYHAAMAVSRRILVPEPLGQFVLGD
jgi:hypothetical protein